MTITQLDRFAQGLTFSLDPFQIQGCRAIESGQGVLVCAPTGAGKTIVGEFAVFLALARGLKCFYTTPIKALSNQKYYDLVAAHGEDAVGLMTGDQVINGGADIVVMTTEVLRNMIYATSPTLNKLAYVVMDEIHYLADASRGAVWEEIILNLDDSVTIVGLSATVSNAEEFGQWLTTVRGDTRVIVTDERPVPLHQWMMVGKRIYPLFEPGSGGAVNKELERAVARLEEVPEERWEPGQRSGFRSRSQGKRSGRAIRRVDKREVAGRPDVLKVLLGHSLLPVITFIFSRAGCDGALYQCLRSQLVLTTEEEAAEISRIVDSGVAGIPTEDLAVLHFEQWKSALLRGFAAHHAGMLPAFRHVVEELFVKGLIRAVFATETLALGINMPARTVVLEKLVKFNGETHADLKPGEYAQLTGRAGRRGIDPLGNAVVEWAPGLDPRAVAGLASTRTYPLVSTFEPGYNMSINLLKTQGFDQALRLLSMSFAQFQADGSVVDVTRDLDRARQRVTELKTQLAAQVSAAAPPGEDPATELLDYLVLRHQLNEEEKSAKKAAAAEHAKEIVLILAKLQVGQVIAMPTKKRPLLAVVVSSASQTQDPRPWIISETGWSGRIEAKDFGNPPIVLGTMKLPRNITHHPKKNTRFVVQAFQRNSYGRPKKLRLEARFGGSRKTIELREKLRSHPVHSWPISDREHLALLGSKVLRAQAQLDQLGSRASTSTNSLGHTFRRILDLLAELDYVEFSADHAAPVVTLEGERLAQIHSQSDLLVAQCLKRGVWNELDPAELAGVASLCVFENRREAPGDTEAATEALSQAISHTMRIWSELSSDERRHRLPMTRIPDSSFALATHQWTAGAPLSYCLAAAKASGAELSAGDFVRWTRQVIDLLEQIAKTAYTTNLKRTARTAIHAMRRGVVAVGT